MIEQLEKYAERSTNRSGNGFYQAFKEQNQKELNDMSQDFDQSTSMHHPFKAKSTKESQFIIHNKQHYLASTHSVFHKKEESIKTQGKEQEDKVKTTVQDGRMKKIKKKKAVSKADIF